MPSRDTAPKWIERSFAKLSPRDTALSRGYRSKCTELNEPPVVTSFLCAHGRIGRTRAVIARVDLDAFPKGALASCDLLEGSVPWFVKPDAELHPIDAISDEWDASTAVSIAPVMESRSASASTTGRATGRRSTSGSFVAMLLLALGDAGAARALRPQPARDAQSSVQLVRFFVASIYAWAGMAKCHADWLSGRTLAALHASGVLAGRAVDLVLASPERRVAVAIAVVLAELAMGPLLLMRRTRCAALGIVCMMHALFQWAAEPDVIGLVMVALLLAFVPSNEMRKLSA